VDRLYLAPRQLTRTEYVNAISGSQINAYMKTVAEEILNFQLDCSLLVCGSEATRSLNAFRS
jgi:ketosteroid isomerase-like protein